ncbi:Hypothetical predicted protein [Olea europaea subsp. europaea]|uniref:Uncharacterized protein n=1 Tax=Olea europaea subsp. europaea TaxID=158383 RepID=A0A8S0TBS2_OLEEU|nr:Hypothetical predicted protein [Olea europaea subsp. europaea]
MRDTRKVDFRAVNVATKVAEYEPCRQPLLGGVKADTRRQLNLALKGHKWDLFS